MRSLPSNNPVTIVEPSDDHTELDDLLEMFENIQEDNLEETVVEIFADNDDDTGTQETSRTTTPYNENDFEHLFSGISIKQLTVVVSIFQRILHAGSKPLIRSGLASRRSRRSKPS
jgi:hypothetical protein